MQERLCGILIAGSSHVGKTTLAARLGEALGWSVTSTDSLARHPGRPWPQVREPVSEYYTRLSPETITWFLKVHHENMWPRIGRMLEDEVQAESRFIFEGSALRPGLVAPLVSDGLAAICLHAERAFLEERMRSGSGYDVADAGMRLLIDRFIERELRDNDAMRNEALENGIQIIDAADRRAVDAVFADLARRGQGSNE